MAAFLKDNQHAVRALLKSPGYSLVAIATLALGIGGERQEPGGLAVCVA
jgi:hypothetical protein